MSQKTHPAPLTHPTLRHEDMAMFSVHGPRITARRPCLLVAGSVVAREAFIEIDSSNMSQDFLLRLMHYIGSGEVRVMVSQVSQEVQDVSRI